MALTFTLDQEQYEALIALARDGVASSPDRVRQLDEFLRLIEKKNGITRDAIWVQWQELDAPVPPGFSFPDEWPPQLRHYIELVTRKVARADVDAVLAAKARTPTSVLITRDPGAKVGWTPVADFFLV